MNQSWPLIALLALCALAFAYLIGLKHGREENRQPEHSKSAITHKSTGNQPVT